MDHYINSDASWGVFIAGYLVWSLPQSSNATLSDWKRKDISTNHDSHETFSSDVPQLDGNEGVIPRALRNIFNTLQEHDKDAVRSQSPAKIKQHRPVTSEFQVKIQSLELYGEEIRDLLENGQQSNGYSTSSKMKKANLRRLKSVNNLNIHSSGKIRSKISIRDGGLGEDAEVLGVENAKVSSAEEALILLRQGLTKRVVGKTAMNAHNSRSHAIFTVIVQQTRRIPLNNPLLGDDFNKRDAPAASEKMNVQMKTSKIHFVDLCGSERVKRAKTTGKRLKEGIDINKGLLVLGNVIAALTTKGASKVKGGVSKTHVPYRDSKLTRLLKGSLGGNHNTLMIACVSPSPIESQ